MKIKLLSLTTTLAFVLASSPLFAHHSAVQYDFSTQKTVTGTVKEFAAKNPHMLLKLEVTDEKGTREVEIEGHSINNMYRYGYRKDMVKVGDKLTVHLAPLKSGVEGGYMVSAETADGKFFGMQSRQLDASKIQAAAEGK